MKYTHIRKHLYLHMDKDRLEGLLQNVGQEAPSRQSPVQQEVSRTLQAELSQTGNQIESVRIPLGPKTEAEARQELQGPLHIPQRIEPMPSAPSAEVPQKQEAHTSSDDPYNTSRNTMKAAGMVGALGSAVGAASAFAIQAALPAAAGSAVVSTGGLAGLGFIGGSILGAQLYMHGKSHANYWGKTKKETGLLGTMGRGIVSSVTIPAAVLYHLVRGRRS